MVATSAFHNYVHIIKYYSYVHFAVKQVFISYEIDGEEGRNIIWMNLNEYKKIIWERMWWRQPEGRMSCMCALVRVLSISLFFLWMRRFYVSLKDLCIYRTYYFMNLRSLWHHHRKKNTRFESTKMSHNFTSVFLRGEKNITKFMSLLLLLLLVTFPNI